jgi:hypothetical protein
MNDVLNHDALVMSRAGHDGDNQPHAVLSVWLGDYFGRLCDSIVTVCTPAKRRSGNRNATHTREFVGPVGLEPTIRITYLAFGNANHDPSSPRVVPLYLRESVDLMER